MKIRTFIALVCATTILVVGLGLSQMARQTLGQESVALEKLHSRSVAEFAKAVIEGRAFLLSSFRENLDSGNKLAKAFLLAQGNEPAPELQKALATLGRKTRCDIVDILRFDARRGANGTLPSELQTALSRARSGKSALLVLSMSSRPALISVSPLRLFDEPVGGVLLGYYLDGEAALEIQRSTGADVRLVMNDVGATPIDVRAEGRTIGAVGLFVSGGPVANISRSTQSELFRTGIVCFLLVLVVLFALLEFGFLRRFKGVLRDITRSSEELSEGRILTVVPKAHPIREVNELSRAFASHLSELRSFQDRIEAKSRTEALGEVTAQVAHDLKGLLSTIERKLDLDHESTFSSEKKDTLKRLFARVRGITSSVVERIRRKQAAGEDAENAFALSEESMSVESAYTLVDAIVAEKAFQYGERAFLGIEMQVADDCHALFVSVQPNEFKRILANVIDNAVEAIDDHGDVCVRLMGDSGSVRVQVVDSGRGISRSVLPRLFHRGASFGKSNGSGLGLWHARTVLTEWRGEITLSSNEAEGTVVEIRLPRMDTPALFITELRFASGTELVIVDDDELVHEVWERRVRDATDTGLALRVTSFSHPDEFKDWYRSQVGRDSSRSFFLVDYNFQVTSSDGLSLIRELGIESRSILVTGLSDDALLRAECDAAGVRILPKPLLPFVRISGDLTDAPLRGRRQS